MKILIASSMHSDAVEELKNGHDTICAFSPGEELKRIVADREVIIFRSGVDLCSDVLECATDLELLIRAGSGTDNVDLDYVRKNNLKLVRVPEPGAKAVAEMSFGMMIGLSRNIYHADKLLRQGRWAKQEMVGYLLSGKVLGIVGAGSIGSRVGMLGAAWGMDVIGVVKHPAVPGKREHLAGKGIRLADFDEVISTANYLSIHVPLKEDTQNLIDENALSRVKKGAYLINLARGGVVDEKALLKALLEGRLLGAALDVHEREGEGAISPLAELPNVLLTPHIGAQTYDTQKEIGDRILEIVKSYQETRDKR